MSARDVVERLRARRARCDINTSEGTIHVRGLTGRERADYYTWLREQQTDNSGAVLLGDQRVIALALCDEQGHALFDDIEAGLIAVADWCVEDVTTVVREILRLSGMAQNSVEDAEKK